MVHLKHRAVCTSWMARHKRAWWHEVYHLVRVAKSILSVCIGHVALPKQTINQFKHQFSKLDNKTQEFTVLINILCAKQNDHSSCILMTVLLQMIWHTMIWRKKKKPSYPRNCSERKSYPSSSTFSMFEKCKSALFFSTFSPIMSECSVKHNLRMSSFPWFCWVFEIQMIIWLEKL